MLIYKGHVYRPLRSATAAKQVYIPHPNQPKMDAVKSCDKIVHNMFNGKPECASGSLLWTSTLEGDTSPWLQWMTTDARDWIGEHAAIFSVAPSAKVYTIDGEDAAKKLYAQFPAGKNDFGNYLMDWAKVAQVFDGARITMNGVYAMPNGWDTESTVWFNPEVLTLDRWVDIEHEAEPEEWYDPDDPDDRDMAHTYRLKV